MIVVYIYASFFSSNFLFSDFLFWKHDLSEDIGRWMVRIVDIMFRVLLLVKILIGVYKVSTNYITSTHISINRKYQNVISKIRTVHLSTSPNDNRRLNTNLRFMDYSVGFRSWPLYKSCKACHYEWLYVYILNFLHFYNNYY